ncbi:Hydroxysteroid dehydrogenase-like protein 2 [Geodia barretti]|uniref:Hydroxysteroid dehydrogenase-like protein 2 n=1 Tax=Geodia barretti TaxID=519541 RepID=A0AA35WQD4_GEOBA|nr:Hydroxysteroid dehydrogenase-like protein 2 [Geodia barretti]
MFSTGKLAGCTLFITGASRGIGKAIALRAARDGANIVIAAKTAEPHPKLPGTVYTAAEEVEKAGGKCLPCVVDIRDEGQLENAVQQTVDRFGGIDIVVNNASAIHLTGTVNTPMKRYDLMMGVNVRGTFLTSKLCIPHLHKSSNPHILNISPPLNMSPRWFSDHCAYTMAKYGMSMCVLGMAEELKEDGIAVNALWPRTAISTAALEMLAGDVGVQMSRKPDIMADAAYLILTQNSRDFTGNFLVDDDVLRDHGVTDLDQYANVPGGELLPDYFLDEAESFKTQWTSGKGAEAAETPPTPGDPNTPAAVFEVVQTLLSPEITSKVNATFHFVLDGENPGHWLLDLKNESGSCGECSPETETDVTMTTNSQLMVDMFKGKVGATGAFMSGKLKIKGNLAAAMQLETLMGKMKSKL